MQPKTAYAMAHAGQLGGGVAQIIRDSSAPYPHLIVFAQERLEPNYYVAAKSILQADCQSHPSPTGRRVVTLFEDLRLRLDAGGAVRWSAYRGRIGATDPHIVAKLLDGLRTAPEIGIIEVGAARLVFDPFLP